MSSHRRRIESNRSGCPCGLSTLPASPNALWRTLGYRIRRATYLKRAEVEGPQDITLHGRSVAVVLSRAAYQRLSGQQASLLDFMQASPLAELDEELVIERDASLTRDLSL